MKNFGSAVGTLFALGLLFSLLAAGYYLIQYVLKVFAALDPKVETLTAIASVVALLCAAIVAEGVKAHRHIEYKAETAAAYERLLSLCCEPANEKECAGSQRGKIEQSLALYGSGKVISAYLKLRRAAAQGGNTQEDGVLLRTLIMEMRGDLGRAEVVRKQDEILALLVDRG